MHGPHGGGFGGLGARVGARDAMPTGCEAGRAGMRRRGSVGCWAHETGSRARTGARPRQWVAGKAWLWPPAIGHGPWLSATWRRRGATRRGGGPAGAAGDGGGGGTGAVKGAAARPLRRARCAGALHGAGGRMGWAGYTGRARPHGMGGLHGAGATAWGLQTELRLVAQRGRGAGACGPAPPHWGGRGRLSGSAQRSRAGDLGASVGAQGAGHGGFWQGIEEECGGRAAGGSWRQHGARGARAGQRRSLLHAGARVQRKGTDGDGKTGALHGGASAAGASTQGRCAAAAP
jgi:hypothetical protein